MGDHRRSLGPVVRRPGRVESILETDTRGRTNLGRGDFKEKESFVSRLYSTRLPGSNEKKKVRELKPTGQERGSNAEIVPKRRGVWAKLRRKHRNGRDLDRVGRRGKGRGLTV